MSVDRILDIETVEGEMSLIIDYEPGKTVAVNLLQGAMNLIESLDGLDRVLLSSVDTTLEPVSIINDVQKSSLKLLLARALKNIPDHELTDLQWKKWIGRLLVNGKYRILKKVEEGKADAPQIQKELANMSKEYADAPNGIIGYEVPSVSDVMDAVDKIEVARSTLSHERVIIQTELGDISLPETMQPETKVEDIETLTIKRNTGEEFFKIKQVDMLGSSQWTVLRNNRSVKVDMLHLSWLEKYHNREVDLKPGDSLLCKYEESVSYDQNQNEVDRKLAVIEVLDVVHPPEQKKLI